MKSKVIALVSVFALILTMSLSVIAAQPTDVGFTYQCRQLTAAVTPDGVNSPGEWDDAEALIVNSDSEIFKNYGRWQGAEGNTVYGPDKLNVTYKIKWDADYLYILEERFDTAYFFQAGKTATEPWCGDGTLFFLALDTGDTKWASAYEPFWVNKCDDGKTKVAVRTWLDGTFVQLEDAEHIGKWKYGGTQNGNMYTTEIVIPWTDMDIVGKVPARAEGLSFWMTPIVPNMSSAEPFLEDWNQLNFHDRGLRADANIDEGGNPAEFPVNWGKMVLAAAIPVAAPEPEAAPPAAEEEAAPAPAKANPTTGDNTVLFVLLFAAAAVVMVKRTSRAK